MTLFDAFKLGNLYLPGPGWSGRPPDQAAFEIGTAELALAVALAVALWNFVHYLLQGGRVRVRMRPAILTHQRALMKGSPSGWSRSQLDHINASTRTRYSVELAEVTVENIGRSGVTVSDISLDLGPEDWRWWRRHTVVPLPVEYASALTSRSVRLEPFDDCTFLYDVWQVIADRREIRPERKVRVRASVRVAGKRLARRSPRWQSWPVRVGQESLVPDHTPTISEIVYSVAWRHLRTYEEPCAYAAVVAHAVEPLLTDGQRPTAETIAGTVQQAMEEAVALEDRDQVVAPPFLAINLWKATHGRSPEE